MPTDLTTEPALLDRPEAGLPPADRRSFTLVVLICGIAGLIGWAFYLAAFAREPGQDWMVYYTAARAWWEGDPALLGDGQRFTAALNERFASYLSWPLPLHPWLYPPHFLLLLLPFALLPFLLAACIFLAASFAGLLAAARLYADRAWKAWLHGASLLLCPATAITICLGQNAFFTTALLAGGFGLIGRFPLLGGALLGCLSYKPQLCLMVPIALIAARQWRALLGAGVAALALVLASAAICGVALWRDWIALMTAPSELYTEWLVAGRLKGQSVYACAVLLGASPWLANLAQAGAALAGGAAVYRSFRRAIALELRMAVLLAATMLAAPHVIGYDAVLLALAASLFFAYAAENGMRFGDIILVPLLWLSPLMNPPSVFRLGLVTPLVILLFIGCVLLRAERMPHPAGDTRPRRA